MKSVSGWLRPSYYYVYGEKVHRQWARVFLTCAVTVLVCALGFKMLMGSGQHTDALEDAHAVSTENITVPEKPSPVLATAPEDHSYEGLQTAVNDWIAKQSGADWSVVVQDLKDPKNIVLANENDTYFTASIYKLFLTIALAQKIPYTNWATKTLNTTDGVKSYAECVQLMISESNNPCGVAIGNELDWAKAGVAIRDQGFKSTSINSSSIQTTARDTSHFLVGLNAGLWFTKEAKDAILHDMGDQKYRDGIPAGCEGCTVLNKTGQLNGYAHDAAIVTDGDSQYAVVVFSKGGSFAQIADLSKTIHQYLHTELTGDNSTH